MAYFQGAMLVSGKVSYGRQAICLRPYYTQ